MSWVLVGPQGLNSWSFYLDDVCKSLVIASNFGGDTLIVVTAMSTHHSSPPLDPPKIPGLLAAFYT